MKNMHLENKVSFHFMRTFPAEPSLEINNKRQAVSLDLFRSHQTFSKRLGAWWLTCDQVHCTVGGRPDLTSEALHQHPAPIQWLRFFPRLPPGWWAPVLIEGSMEGGVVSEAGPGSCRSDWISTRSQWGLSGGIMLSRRLYNLWLRSETEPNAPLSLSFSVCDIDSHSSWRCRAVWAREGGTAWKNVCVCVCVCRRIKGNCQKAHTKESVPQIEKGLIYLFRQDCVVL